MWKKDTTARYVRFRVRDPKRFIRGSFRTHDVGRVGSTKRIAGRLRRSGKWATQAIIIEKGSYPRVKRTKWFRYAKSRYKKVR